VACLHSKQEYTFGFVDNLALNRHSRFSYAAHELRLNYDHDQYTPGTTKYPPRTGGCERCRLHSIQSETLIKYLAKNPQTPCRTSDLEGLLVLVAPIHEIRRVHS
jgi:hypothetical protein